MSEINQQLSQLLSETRTLHEQIHATHNSINSQKDALDASLSESIATTQQRLDNVTADYQATDAAHTQTAQSQQTTITQLQQDLTTALGRIHTLENTEPPRVYEEYNTTNRSFGNGWSDGQTWTTRNFRGNNNVSLFLSIPCRNDSTNWGGLYTEVQYSLNNGSWISLGHSGYDGVMGHGAQLILTYTKQFLILDDNQIPNSDYTLRIKFRHRSYEGTTHVNQKHALSGKRFGSILRLTEIPQ